MVEQNYELSEDVLREMGVHTIPIPQTKGSKVGVNIISVESYVDKSEYETIDITVLRRSLGKDVLDVSEIGNT